MNVRARVLQGKAVRPGPLADETGLSASGIYEGIKKGRIRAVRIGGALSIPADEAARLLGMDPSQVPGFAEAA